MTDAKVALVIRAVSTYFNTPEQYIRSYQGHEELIVLYRQIAFYLCNKLFHCEEEILLSEFQIKDISVLRYSINKIECLLTEEVFSGLDKSLQDLSELIIELDEIRRRDE